MNSDSFTLKKISLSLSLFCPSSASFPQQSLASTDDALKLSLCGLHTKQRKADLKASGQEKKKKKKVERGIKHTAEYAYINDQLKLTRTTAHQQLILGAVLTQLELSLISPTNMSSKSVLWNHFCTLAE